MGFLAKTKAYADKRLHKPLLFLSRIGLRPHHFTILALICGVASAYFLFDNPLSAALLVLFLVFDGLDGALARASSRESERGTRLDFFVDRLVATLLLLKFYVRGVSVVFPLVGLLAVAATVVDDLRQRK
ncbi:Bifunctional IPC transferase and DIPP synthase [uncultured archaeon]|nr:Bifunctional IPC transferase and DIPP synthase [uncultured archaeon]